MGAGKILNTGNALYGNITRALSGDIDSQLLRALDGGVDTASQSFEQAYTLPETTATWTSSQGIARDATNWFAINTTEIRKYDLSSNLLVTNSTPFAGLPATLDHCGDGFVDGLYLYVAVSNFSGGTSTQKVIAKYLLTTLALDSYFDLVAETNLNASGCCLNKAGDEILVVSFYSLVGSDSRNTDIYRFNKSTGALLGVQALSAPSVGIQGITYHAADDRYYISSYDNATISSVYAYDADFTYKSRRDPFGSIAEIEGVESFDGVLYYNHINEAPRQLDTNNLFITQNTTLGSPVQFLDASLMSGQKTMLIRASFLSLYNFNTVFDNETSGNDWESWVYSDGRLAFRVTAVDFVIVPGIAAGQEHLIAFTWDEQGTSSDIKVGIDGTYRGSNLGGSWTAPPTTGLWLAGINSGNTQGNSITRDVLLFDKVLSDSELLDAYNNFDDFYSPIVSGISLTATLGTIEYNSNDSVVSLAGSVDVTATLGSINYSSNDASIQVSGDVNLIATLGAIDYTSSDTNISLLGNVDIAATLGTINYSSNDVGISLTGGINVTATLGVIDYASNDSVIILQGQIPVTATLGAITYDSYNVTVQIGTGQFIGTVTAGFANDIYSAGFKPSAITVNFKS